MKNTSFTSQKFTFFSFLSMFLLVYVHGYNLNQTYLQPFTIVHEPVTFTTFFEYLTANGLFRFRIPMLFIISGYLFALHDSKPYKERIAKRSKTVLLPYFLWSATALLFTFLLQQFPVTAKAVVDAAVDQFGDNRPYEQIGWRGMLDRFIFAPPSFQLWFLRVLFFYNLLYPLIRKAVTGIPYVWFPFAGLLWLGTIGLYFIEGEGLLFFSLGVLLAKKEINIEQEPRWLKVKWMAPLFIGTSLIKTALAFQLPESNSTALLLMLLHKLVIFSGLVTMWFGINKIVRWCISREWFVLLTGFSFIIYAMHVPLINYMHHLLKPWFSHWTYYRLLDYLLLPLLVITLIVLTGAVWRKLMPGFYRLMTGGRGFN
jgi:fucose 4-O-acetylase-like acetyltransferase